MNSYMPQQQEENGIGLRAVCFVDMPFGKKSDLASGVEVDFDHIYESAIKPAIQDCKLEPVRGDQERTGGIVHAPMFGRLLLSDYVVADLTLSNANVFYELGIRHTARPFTTVPIFATIHSLPFDVSLVRAIPYSLDNGKLTGEAAAKLRADLTKRLEDAKRGAASADSPLFQLIAKFPKIDLPHEVTEIFQDFVRHSEEFRNQLADARALSSNEERLKALKAIEDSLGDLQAAQSEILVDLMLSYRDVGAWDDMIRLSEGFHEALKSNVLVRQQRGLAFNRRNQPGDRDRAEQILKTIEKEKGPDPETLGILGRVYKDRYKELKKTGKSWAIADLDAAIEAYTRGFESDPRDYYPGVNAITLLVEKGDADAMKEVARLQPLVTFAVARRGGANSNDYWDLATVLELSAIGKDWTLAMRVLPKVLRCAKAAWMAETTQNNLLLLKAARERAGEPTPELDEVIGELNERQNELKGQKAAG
jgi:tetratricopeptide (TPR) repeat protein